MSTEHQQRCASTLWLSYCELCCRKESGELRKQMSELETKNRTLAVNLQQREADFKQKAAAIEVGCV